MSLQFNQASAEETLDKFDEATETTIVRAIQAAKIAKQIENNAHALQQNGEAIVTKVKATTDAYLPESVAGKVNAATDYVSSLIGSALPYVISYSQKSVRASQAAVTLGINAQVAAEQARGYVELLPEVKEIEENPTQSPKL